MRECLAFALATHVGRTLTPELASEIARGAYKPFDFAPFPAARRGQWALQAETLRQANDVALHRIRYLTERHPGRPQRTDWLTLLERQEMNSLVIFTARNEGALVASIWLTVGRNVDTGELAVSDDLIYVEPEWRGSSALQTLWRFAERTMFDRGVREASFSMRIQNGAERMARFMGYTPVATRVTKFHYGDRYEDAPTRHKQEIHHEPT